MPSGMLQVGFMDAGQGDATLLVYPDDSLVLVDCGCIKSGDVVASQIGPILGKFAQTAPNKGLRALVLTHPDQDHYNLVYDLIISRNIPVDRVIIGGERSEYGNLTSKQKKRREIQIWLNKMYAANKLDELDPNHLDNEPSPVLTLPDDIAYGLGVEVRIIAANLAATKKAKTAKKTTKKKTASDKRSDTNTGSIVLLVSYSIVNLFLMGDATEITEKLILEKFEAEDWLRPLLAGKHTALKVGHHGSDTSSSPGWLQAINPEVAFISSDTRGFGKGGVISLPRAEIVDRIMNNGSRLYDFGPPAEHGYVDYTAADAGQKQGQHNNLATTEGMYTSLFRLDYLDTFPPGQAPPADRASLKQKRPFRPVGTWWWYVIETEPPPGHPNPDISVRPTDPSAYPKAP